MNIPQLFKNRIIEIMGEENAEIYLKNLGKPQFCGIRANLIKISKENFEKILGVKDSSPFCDYLYYVDKSSVNGNNPYHHCGAFYFQEPSASSAVTALSPKKGDFVLDMCASPGGKTTQIAPLIGDNGLIWSNEAVTQRIQPLISNIERLGIKNAVVSNSHPELLTNELPEFFDKVLVDAPCSGEGMIRKDNSILNSWSIENINICAVRQLKILESAAKCLKNGGLLCYSTCTFAYEENEQVIESFLSMHSEFELIKIEKPFGSDGLKRYAPHTKNIEYARRIFPKDGGEGHFVALMKKSGDIKADNFCETEKQNNEIKIFKEFYSGTFKENYSGIAVSIKDKVYIKPNIPTFNNVGVVRQGVFCGEVKKNRFEPSHALFMAYGNKALNIVNFNLQDKDLYKFLHGEEIECDGSLKGFTAVTLDGMTLGFGKASNGRLKNRYPKGLRTLQI